MDNKYNDVDSIIKVLNDYYETELHNHIKYNGYSNTLSNNEFVDLKTKLLQTTQQFVRSFDYDLGRSVSFKRKLINYVKRVIRKLMRFMTKPYADQMLKYQESSGELFGMLINTLEHLCVDNKNFEKNNNELMELQKNLNLIINQQIDKINNSDVMIKNLEDNINLFNSEINEYKNKTFELSEKIKNILVEEEKMQEYNEACNNKFFSYSQTGEDSIIDFLINYGGNPQKAFSYLDIGCNHYKIINNTYRFYKQGYRGVLIEANPLYIDEIKENRPEDTVLNVGIGTEDCEDKIFYIVNNPDMSSFNKDAIDNAISNAGWLKIEKEINIPVMSLTNIINKYFIATPALISMDIEGDELNILNTLDFELYRPYIFVIETIEFRPRISIDNKRIEIVDFMKQKDYAEYAFTGVNSIFIDKRKINK